MYAKYLQSTKPSPQTCCSSRSNAAAKKLGSSSDAVSSAAYKSVRRSTSATHFFLLSFHAQKKTTILIPLSLCNILFSNYILFAHLSETLKITICLNLIRFGFSQLFHRISITFFVSYLPRERQRARERTPPVFPLFLLIYFLLFFHYTHFMGDVSRWESRRGRHTRTHREVSDARQSGDVNANCYIFFITKGKISG